MPMIHCAPTSPLPKCPEFWPMYVEMVLMMKQYITAERAGIWEDHLTEVTNMIPFIISARHNRYAQCLPIYLKDMRSLERTHPEVYTQFTNGNFTVRQKTGRYNGVWSDLALEQTYNREGKMTLLKGLAANPSTQQKYIKAAPLMTKVSQSIKQMANVGTRDQTSHHGSSSRQVKADIEIVENMKKLINGSFVNPYTTANRNNLVNICSGVELTSHDLLKAKTAGVDALKAVVEGGMDTVILPKITRFVNKKRSASNSCKVTNIYKDETAIT